MKGVFCVFVAIALLLFGCSVTTNKKNDNKNLQNSSKVAEKSTKEDKEEVKEKSKTDKKTADKSKETNNTKKNNDGTAKTNSSTSKSSSVSSNPIVQAALKYRGSSMACDQLATMALVDAGIITGTPEEIFHDGAYYNIGVYQFPSLGTFISASSAQPGDLIYYDDGGFGSAHIAVYAGNGQAVHGGWLGNQVVLDSVDIGGSTPKYMKFPAQSWDTISNILFPSSNEGIGDYPSDIPSYPDEPSDSENNSATTTYTSTMSLNDFTVTVTSPTPIDESFMWLQMESYIMGEITYEQFVVNVQEKGYTIV